MNVFVESNHNYRSLCADIYAHHAQELAQFAQDMSKLTGVYPVHYELPGIIKIYFNKKHTTIEWADGTKTTVGCIEGQEFDEYAGFTAALAKRLFGSSSAAIRFMNEHKEVQPEHVKKAKKATTETAVTQDA